jgi:hypothetical protein
MCRYKHTPISGQIFIYSIMFMCLLGFCGAVGGVIYYIVTRWILNRDG